MNAINDEEIHEMTKHPMITCTPGVMGGYPCIAGTRISVRDVLANLEVYDGDMDEVLRCWPHISREQIDAALRYYEECPELVDEDIARQEEAIAKILSGEWDHVVVWDGHPNAPRAEDRNQGSNAQETDEVRR